MDVGDINIQLREIASIENAREGFLARPGMQYIDVIKLLHNTFGGNYRALEFFDRLVKENPDRIMVSLDSLEKFRESSKETTDKVKHLMGQNLLFSQLISLLSPEQQRVLELLSHFRIPVQQFALQLQIQNQSVPQSIDFKPILETLNRLTLIEFTLDQEIKTIYCYVTPIVKDLLTGFDKIAEVWTFSHKHAGAYYYHYFHNTNDNLASLEESFYHFYESADKEKVQEIGDLLSEVYYGYSMYHNAFFYTQRVYQLLGDETDRIILDRLGLIYKLYGPVSFRQVCVTGCGLWCYNLPSL
jgi:hypothetical protein